MTQSTEEPLNQKNLYLDLIEQLSGVGHWQIDIDNRTVSWSRESYIIHGVAPEIYNPELESLNDFYHADDRELLTDHLEQAMHHQRDFECRLRLIKNDGATKNIFLKGRCIETNGRAIIFVIIQDITREVQSLEKTERMFIELDESKQFQRLINESNPDYIFVKDSQYRIVYGNKAFFGLYPKEFHDQIIGYTTVEKYNKKEADDFLEQDRIAFDKGSSEVLEEISFPDGSIRVLMTKKTRFENHKGESFILGIARDVTEREQLIKELERSNKELDDFAYIASHDLKQPLRGIYNYSCFLLEDYEKTLDAEGGEMLQTLKRLSQRLERLLNELMDYSRISRKSMQKEKVDISFILNEIKDTLKPVLLEDNIALKINYPLPVISCEKILINELFTNLIVNAMKYNDKKEKWIEVGVIKPADQDIPVFYVRDNGIGIKEKYQQAVFRIFKRLNSKDKFGDGTGFGLTIAKKIIEQHHGKIWLESVVDEGTTFYFTLGQATIS